MLGFKGASIKSYSQLCEDIYVYNRFINVARPDIVCVEFGAFDGKKFSNTLLFEEQCNAHCILVEPSPANCKKIRANRPSSTVHQFAVSDELGTAEFLGDSAVSGIVDNLEPEYIERWNLASARRYKVLTVPANIVLQLDELTYVDFLSVDIQGGELQVLQSLDWNLPIGVICLELEDHHPDNDKKCREILKDNEFLFSGRLKISEIWYNPSYFRAKTIFDPNRTRPQSSFRIRDYVKKHLPELQEALDDKSTWTGGS